MMRLTRLVDEPMKSALTTTAERLAGREMGCARREGVLRRREKRTVALPVRIHPHYI